MFRWFTECWNSLRFLFGNGRKQNELEDELDCHIGEAVDDLVEQGMDPDEARKMALREFGGVEQIKEECRDSWGVRVLTGLIRDFRYSARMLWKSKGFSLAVIATLALCIGANTAIFSVLYDLVWKPLPFKDAENIVQIYNVTTSGYNQKFNSGASWFQYHDFSDEVDLFDGFALAYQDAQVFETKNIQGFKTSHEFFSLMGVQPLLGRFYGPDEVHPNPANVVVLSQSAWENDFGADPNVVGKTMHFLDRGPQTIIGVAPRSVEVFDARVRFFSPLYLAPRSVWVDPQYRFVNAYLWARLKPNVSRTQAIGRLTSIERQWYEEVATPETRKRYDHDGHRFWNHYREVPIDYIQTK